MLSDSVADSKMSYITWIIIILIGVSIVVTVSEVVLRFAMLEKSKDSPVAVGAGNVTGIDAGPAEAVGVLSIGAESTGGAREEVLSDVKRLVEGMGAEDLRRWRAVLSAEQMEGICGGEARVEL